MGFLIAANSAYSCSCYPISIDEYLHQNDSLKFPDFYVIKGIVVENKSSLYHKFGAGSAVDIKILEVWPKVKNHYFVKGTITIFNDENDCKVDFIKDSTYLVMARTFGRYLQTSECEGTVLLKDNTEDLSGIGESKKFVVDDADTDQPQNENALHDHYDVQFIVSIIVNVILLFLLLKKSSKKRNIF